MHLLFVATWLVHKPVGLRMHDMTTRNRTTNLKTSIPVQPGASVFKGRAASLQPLTKALLSRSPAQHYSAVNSAAVTVQPLSHAGEVLGSFAKSSS